MRTLQAVFWDVDGTLADTELSGHRPSFNNSFKSFNLDWFWDIPLYIELLHVQGGFNRIKEYARLRKIELSDHLISQIHYKKQQYYKTLVHEGYIPLRIGVKRLVSELHENNIDQWIVTTSSKHAVDSLLRHNFQGNQPFKGAITYEDVVSHKPNPEAYQKALVQSGQNPCNCLTIEDSIPGLTAARSASIPCLLTLTDWNKYTHDSMSSSSAVVNNLGENDSPCKIFQGISCQEGLITVKYLQDLINSI